MNTSCEPHYCLNKVGNKGLLIARASQRNVILLAIHGYGFCFAAKRAFRIIASNALRLAAINSVGDFVLFLGKVATISVVTVVGIQLISVRLFYKKNAPGIFIYKRNLNSLERPGVEDYSVKHIIVSSGVFTPGLVTGQG